MKHLKIEVRTNTYSPGTTQEEMYTDVNDFLARNPSIKQILQLSFSYPMTKPFTYSFLQYTKEVED